MNTEEMYRAAITFDNAADQMKRVVEQFDYSVDRLERLIGSGYGNNIERLIEALENMPSGNN
jgi:hypothetical protein